MKEEIYIFKPSDDEPYEAHGYVYINPSKSDWKYWNDRNLKPIRVVDYVEFELLRAEAEKLAKDLQDAVNVFELFAKHYPKIQRVDVDPQKKLLADFHLKFPKEG